MTLTARIATTGDITFVWTCRQELAGPVTRQSQTVEVFADHKTWMTQAVSDPGRLFLIAQKDDVPIGYVRFDPTTNPTGWRVSLCLRAAYRGGGHGRAALALGCAMADQTGRSPQFADIHPTNPASAHVFEACGFTAIDVRQGADGFNRYIRTPAETEPTL